MFCRWQRRIDNGRAVFPRQPYQIYGILVGRSPRDRRTPARKLKSVCNMVGRPPRGRRTLARKLKSVCFLVGRPLRGRRMFSSGYMVGRPPRGRRMPRPPYHFARFERKALLHANAPGSGGVFFFVWRALFRVGTPLQALVARALDVRAWSMPRPPNRPVEQAPSSPNRPSHGIADRAPPAPADAPGLAKARERACALRRKAFHNGD